MAGSTRWMELATHLKKGIDDGTYAVGEQLPNYKELAAQGWTSTGTVRDAYRSLVSQGYAVVKHGSGCFVRDRSVVSIPLSRYAQASGLDGLGPWETATRQQGLAGEMVLVDVTTVEAPVSIAAKLSLSEATGYQVTCRSRHAIIRNAASGDEVLQIQQAWYPAEVARRCGLDRAGKREGGVLPALAAAYHLGAAGTERVGFRLATEAEVSTLNLAPGWFVLRAERLITDESGTPLELLQIAAVPDRVDFVYDGLNYQRLPS
ncbi:GntR family transcriptional regulator [Kitasatospora sp. NPDC101801]|uniref:GntR family transcriptional regulator n=1 Tax=Kitasatospora sp. NPDC101801 TaxID=3364103 RepID=UPI00380285A9